MLIRHICLLVLCTTMETKMLRQLRQAVGSEALFIKKYGPRFRLILEAVSEVVYTNRGVSESEVAVTLHK